MCEKKGRGKRIISEIVLGIAEVELKKCYRMQYGMCGTISGGLARTCTNKVVKG